MNGNDTNTKGTTMNAKTQLVANALSEIRTRLVAEGSTRAQIAGMHRMARSGFSGEECGRKWTDSVVRNYLVMAGR
jgi:hypothetical protein